MRRALVASTAVLALVLTGCSSTDPRAERRGDVEAIVAAANDGDAGAVRDAVEDLLSTLREQVAGNDLDREEAERLRVLGLRIAEESGLLEAEPSPSPTPAPVQTEEEEEPEEEPSPEPTQEDEPSPEPTVEETEEPEPSPVVDLPVQESPTPAQVSQPAPSSQPEEPSPAPSA